MLFQAALAYVILVSRQRAAASPTAASASETVAASETTTVCERPTSPAVTSGLKDHDCSPQLLQRPRLPVSVSEPGLPVLVSELGSEAGRLLWSRAGVQVRFDAEEAVTELHRLGLVSHPIEGEGVAVAATAWPGAGGLGMPTAAAALSSSAGDEGLAASRRGLLQSWADKAATVVEQHSNTGMLGSGSGRSRDADSADTYSSAAALLSSSPLAVSWVAPVGEAIRLVQSHWDALLWARVDSILREFE